MKEYFVVTNSFAAPFISDQGTRFVEAHNPNAALRRVAKEYKHPAGLYAADCYESADAYHKNEPRLARWLSNKAQACEGATSLYSDGPEKVEIDGEWREIPDPKNGRVVDAR